VSTYPDEARRGFTNGPPLTGVDIKKGALTGANIKKSSLTGANIKKSSLTGANIKNNSLSGAQINEGSLSSVPSAGNAEKVGGKGPGAFQAADHWALIAGSATGANILAQSGGLSVQRFNTGIYLVNVGASVVGKPLSATFNFPSAGFASVARCGGTANNPGGANCPVFNDKSHVVVVTRSTAAAAADSSFYISIGG
jgi:Pentapeptide repeats (8 copies)